MDGAPLRCKVICFLCETGVVLMAGGCEKKEILEMDDSLLVWLAVTSWIFIQVLFGKVCTVVG